MNNITNRLKFAGIYLNIPRNWVDITDSLPPGTPYTLAREQDGFGVLQFSIGKYKTGKLPNITCDSLRIMLSKLLESININKNIEIVIVDKEMKMATCIFPDNGSICHIYYISDGMNLANISYTVSDQVDDNVVNDELRDVITMINSVGFNQ